MTRVAGRIFHRIGTFRLGLLFLGALAAVLVALPSDAHPPWITSSSDYSVTLEDEQGSPLRTFRNAGTTWVLGAIGDRYNVRLRNNTGRRVEAVLTIDGRDAISGRAGDYVRQRGYVIPPYDSVLVDGFRKSLDESAAFRFSSPGASYSSRMGTPENVGVLGVAFFAERVEPRPVLRPVRPVRPVRPFRPRDDLYDYDASAADRSPRKTQSEASGASRSGAAQAPSPEARSADEAPAPSRSAPAAKGRSQGWADLGRGSQGSAEPSAPSRLGTEYGEDRYSPVREVSFVRQRSSEPSVLLTLRYDDERGLLARGIDVYPERYWPERRADAPEAFPVNRFAPPPP
jgi:hypothetical protein